MPSSGKFIKLETALPKNEKKSDSFVYSFKSHKVLQNETSIFKAMRKLLNALYTPETRVYKNAQQIEYFKN